MSRTYLVTGGAGFIGSHIVSALVERGDAVRVLDNLSTGRRENLEELAADIEFVEGDLLDKDVVAAAVRNVHGIFHEAALASVPRSVEQPLDTHAACVTGTVNLLDQARQAGVSRVVYAASSSSYGNQPHSPKREADLPAPLSPYAASKLAAEYYCQAFSHTYGIETVAIRYFNVFGPGQDPDGSQSRDFTFVANVVHGNLLAMDAASSVSGRVMNVANGRATSLLELLQALNKMLGTNIEPILAPPRIGDVRESLADITLATQLLGYEPIVGFEEGLRRSIAYYRSLIAS